MPFPFHGTEFEHRLHLDGFILVSSFHITLSVAHLHSSEQHRYRGSHSPPNRTQCIGITGLHRLLARLSAERFNDTTCVRWWLRTIHSHAYCRSWQCVVSYVADVTPPYIFAFVFFPNGSIRLRSTHIKRILRMRLLFKISFLFPNLFIYLFNYYLKRGVNHFAIAWSPSNLFLPVRFGLPGRPTVLYLVKIVVASLIGLGRVLVTEYD